MQKIIAVYKKNIYIWKNSFFNFKFYEYNSSRFTGGKRIQIQSKALPIFNYYYNLFYKNGKKVITKEILDKLKPLGIAVWHCDDGHLDLLKGEIVLGTYTSYEENFVIKQWFKERFGIDAKIRKRNNCYVIIFNPENTKKFISLIKDYVPRCMSYKINYNEKLIREKQRIANKKNYSRNYEKILESSKKYYRKNREMMLRKHKEWVNQNRKRFYEYQKLWRQMNRKKVKEWGRKYRDRNKQKEALRHKIYYFKNRDKILAKNYNYYKLWKLEKIIEFGK